MNILVFIRKIHTNIKEVCIIKKGRRQVFIVLNLPIALYSNLIGQRQAIVSTADQPKALLEHGKIWSLGPNFDHFAQCQWSLSNKRRSTAKWNQKAKV